MVKVFKYYNDLFFYHLAEFCLSTVYLQLFHSDIPEEKMNYFFPSGTRLLHSMVVVYMLNYFT